MSISKGILDELAVLHFTVLVLPLLPVLQQQLCKQVSSLWPLQAPAAKSHWSEEYVR